MYLTKNVFDILNCSFGIQFISKDMNVVGPFRPPLINNNEKQHSINRGWAYKWILGSAFIASIWEFLVFFVISVAWFVLFEFAIEPAYPTLFPISSTYQISIFFVITFAGALYVGVERDLYASLISSYVIACGNIETLAYEVTSFVGNDNKSVNNYFIFKTDKFKENTFLIEVLKDCNLIIRSIPFAERHEHRSFTEKNKSFKKKTIDESDIGSNLEIELLPMSDALKEELSMYKVDNTTSGLADQLFDMLMKRLNILYTEQILNPILFQSIDRQISGITTSTAEIVANKMIGATPIIVGFLKLILWIWCFSIPWTLWGEYRWWSILVFPVVVWPLLAMFESGKKLADPFAPYNLTPYNWNNMALISKSCSNNVDKIFDQKFKLMMMEQQYNKRSGQVGKSNIFFSE